MHIIITLVIVVVLSAASVVRLVWSLQNWRKNSQIISEARLAGRVFRARCIQVAGDVEDEHVGVYDYIVDGKNYQVTVDNCHEDNLDVYWPADCPEKAVTELDAGMTGIAVLPLIVWKLFYLFVQAFVVYCIVGLVCQYFAQ